MTESELLLLYAVLSPIEFRQIWVGKYLVAEQARAALALAGGK